MKDKLRVLISEEEVSRRIREMAGQISRDYEGKELRIVCVLKGGVFFMCELAKHITVPVTFDFMAVSSYGNGHESSGALQIVKDLDESVEGKDILVVEDIVDSGNTLSRLLMLLKERNPKSLRLCTLLAKPERRETEVPVDYTGFLVPNLFVVGYGMDDAQYYRNLPYIAVVEQEE